MKLGWMVASVFVIGQFLLAHAATAQTLTEALMAEVPATLAEQARLKGDIVRGAILFHQGNINCAKCHRASAEQEQIGPDLSRMDRDLTDELIVDAILQPSKEIKKGFETTIVLSVDGRVLTGIILREDETEVVLRDIQNTDQVITILREDIEERKLSELSSMPANLANELKDRQQFLDLLRYVMDIRDRGPEIAGEKQQSTQRRELASHLDGFALIQQFNCLACHTAESFPAMVTAKQSPRLAWSANRLNPEWVARFIANPHGTKPGTPMPDLLKHLDEESQQSTATAITHFLMSKADNSYRAQTVDPQAVSRGNEMFHSVGCVACHSPRNDEADELPWASSASLGTLNNKYNISGLVEFLEDPLAVRPSGHMPQMRLSHREATDIANYLLQSATQDSTAWKVDAKLAAQGEVLFTQHNCLQCHTDLVPTEKNRSGLLNLHQLRAGQGCLSEQVGAWPAFELSVTDRQNITSALQMLNLELTPQQQIDVSLRTFNCLACHDRDQLGGVAMERNPHFQTTNLNLGDQGRIPPTLTGVGAKLQQKWLRDVLVNGKSIRPYMKTRMPQHGEDNIGHLVELFSTHDKLSDIAFAEFADQEAMRKKGLELAGNEGLNCVACHTYQYKISDTMPAVDLTEMAERLQKDWFYQYMLAPQKFSPNTVMPSYWPGGNAIRQDLEGTASDQIEALWQYLIDGRQAAMPRGVVREPLEIVVTNEAQILRRSYPGIGKRGIGVGYPGGVNLIFDAEHMRLGSIWKGKFVDPGGVWTGQGSGTARPLGNPIEFPRGPELDETQQPWVVDDGRPPHHQFLGYELDGVGRPTFRYRLNSISVEDYFSEVNDQSTGTTHLRRTVVLSPADIAEEFRFRLASAENISTDDGVLYSVGEKLKIRMISGPKPQISQDANGTPLLSILLQTTTGEDQKWVFEYLWQ